MIIASSLIIRRLCCPMRRDMHSPSCILLFFSITILVFFNHFGKCEARDSINVSSPLIDNGDTLVSAGNIFELGFFTPPEESNKSYVGIWYYSVTPKTVVWVANRKRPLPALCGLFGIAEDGNLELWCRNGGARFWAAAPQSSKHFNQTVRLLDTGNLLFYDGQSGSRLWQSFDYPTDTFLPDMKMDSYMELISWVNPTDPSPGDYTFKQLDQDVYTIQNRSIDYWRSGDPNFPTEVELPSIFQTLKDSKQEQSHPLMKSSNSRHVSYNNFSRSSNYNLTRLLMNSSGEIQYYGYSPADGWISLWSRPNNPCSVYNPCGKFAICRMEKEPICHCLPGYKSTSTSESWRPGPNIDGCYRDRLLKCSLEDGHKDSFLNKSFLKVGGDAIKYDGGAENETACKDECSSRCICAAYLYTTVPLRDRESGGSAGNCWIWNSDLVNLQDDDNNGGQNLVIRVPFSPTGDFSLPSEQTCDSSADCNDGPNSKCEDRGNGQRRCSRRPKNKFPMKYVIALIVLVAGVVLISCTSYVLYQKRRMTIRTGNQGNAEANPVRFPDGSERQVSDQMQENDKGIDVPLYSFDTILSATDNFSAANKLGQGGFGPVYKGKFPGGREIAVKRLSSCSGQGIDEFLNEVLLIAKLQHRNLVRLLGYCIKENEKILLYEYMPNRSLDAFIFDQNNCLLIDWKKRFDIILGIARGLLYLHQDSRLRIIHRDLKTSNILLDEEMNPKISDFGLARIVQGKGTEASTNKVVGTYGYLSPEYALDGKFSTKSDVFSFGVVMLEIISGKRNKDFYYPHEVLNLLGYAWRLWSENKALDLAHPTLVLEHDGKSQVTKCINVGLLCVQEDPNERPSMSTVVIMLGSEMSVPLPSPTQPAFVMRRRHSSTASSSSTKQDTVSYNELTLSMEQGR